MSNINDQPDLVPVRMLNEFTYCPRLAYLEWTQGDFVDSADTVEGRFKHRRVDNENGDIDKTQHARSVQLSASTLGLSARIDLVESAGQHVTPVDYKRGEAPDLPEGAWEPERVQLCAYGLVLEENNYTCSEGVLYFVDSKTRVTIAFTPELRARTRELLTTMREMHSLPPPLQDSPKCPRCSLVSICLPDETNLLRGVETTEPRRLLPARDDALPLYVQSPGTRVGKSGDELTVQPLEGQKSTVRLGQTSQISLFGPVQISTQAVQAVLMADVPISYFTTGGWFYGMTTGHVHKNVELRRQQYRAADDTAVSLTLARKFVIAKITNCRTLLRRNAPDNLALDALRASIDEAIDTQSQASLLGIEGSAARYYFQNFSKMVKGEHAFDFTGRNRRPPRDPINALLSFAYSLLTKDLAVTARIVGFDPMLGFYHPCLSGSCT